jgi:type I restriction enzyme S subunit
VKPIFNSALPFGWREKPLKDVAVRRRGYSWDKSQETTAPENGSTPVIRIPDVQDALNLTNLLYLRSVPPGALETSGVTKNWVLYVGSNGNPERIGDSVLISEDRPMVFASFLQGISTKDPTEILPEFFAYWMHLHSVHQTFSKTSQQTTGLANFSWSAVKRLPLRYPVNIEEQRKIVTALSDVQDAITAAQQHLLAAQRTKTALMQQLFTKGIPGMHTKQRTVNLGRRSYTVPVEWEVKKMQELLSERLVNGVSPQSRPDPPGNPILNVSCIGNGICDPKQATYVDVDEATFDLYRAKKGDFFVLRGNGNIDYVASGGLLRVEPDPACMFSDLLIRLRFNDNVVDGFIPWMWQSKSFLHRLQSKAKSGSGLWKIGLRDIRSQYALLPSKDEQERIVTSLESSREVIDAIDNKMTSLLRLKKSLLQNLLTGKVRVNMEAHI